MSNTDFLLNIGKRISNRRKEIKLTQEQLAEKMGVSLQTISCIELGKKAIRPENLANLCIHLDVSADYILFGRKNEQQMNDVIYKLSELSPDAYKTIHELITLLHQTQNNK